MAEVSNIFRDGAGNPITLLPLGTPLDEPFEFTDFNKKRLEKAGYESKWSNLVDPPQRIWQIRASNQPLNCWFSERQMLHRLQLQAEAQDE